MRVSFESLPRTTLALAQLRPSEALRVAEGTILSIDGQLRQEESSVTSLPLRVYAGDTSGEITLSAPYVGNLQKLSLKEKAYWVQEKSLLAADPEVTLRPLGSSVGLWGFVEASGAGDILLGGFGSLWETTVEPNDRFELRHLVAFSTELPWSLERFGGFWASLFAKEQILCSFASTGRVWLQARALR